MAGHRGYLTGYSTVGVIRGGREADRCQRQLVADLGRPPQALSAVIRIDDAELNDRYLA